MICWASRARQLITPAPVPPATTVPLTAQGSTPLGVVDAKDQTVLQLVTTFNVPAVTTGRGDVQTHSGKRYNNEYCFVFRFRDGKIAEIVEYGDTDLLERALGSYEDAVRQVAAR